ncbi:MAG TPA: hypothetical protein VNV88_09015 [Candidatus Solibacter sp.]|nr:hypothetical protein [Candidatus Solibacter sp.]
MLSMRNACSRIVLLIFLGISFVTAQEPQAKLPPATDPKEIVRRAIETDQRNWALARNYTCQERVAEKRLNSQGAVKSQAIKTYDVTIYYDEPYHRLIQTNDKPLTEKEERKEEEKLDKLIARRKGESEHERQKRLEKQEKQRQEDRAFARDVINAYDFRMAGEEQVEGRDVYVIEAVPRKDFHPTQPHADILSKIRGKAWIDKQDYGWVKIQAEVIDTISFGFFLARIHKGSHLELEQGRVNNEIWLPRRIVVDASARLMLLMNGAFEQESTFTNYKKFATTYRFIPEPQAVQPDPPK